MCCACACGCGCELHRAKQKPKPKRVPRRRQQHKQAMAQPLSLSSRKPLSTDTIRSEPRQRKTRPLHPRCRKRHRSSMARSSATTRAAHTLRHRVGSSCDKQSNSATCQRRNSAPGLVTTRVSMLFVCSHRLVTSSCQQDWMARSRYTSEPSLSCSTCAQGMVSVEPRDSYKLCCAVLCVCSFGTCTTTVKCCALLLATPKESVTFATPTTVTNS
jgi:hypothetical protein